MEDDGYRSTVRAIADRFCKLKGQPPYPPVELEGVEQRATAAREVAGVAGGSTEGR